MSVLQLSNKAYEAVEKENYIAQWLIANGDFSNSGIRENP